MKNETKTSDTEETNGTVKETDKQHYGKIRTDEELLTRNPDSKQMIETIGIENTPFTAVKTDGKWYLTMGRYRLEGPLETKDHVLAAGTDESWHRIMQVIMIMIEDHEQRKGKEPNQTQLEGEIQTRKLK